jgi:hypothetical protein
MHLMNLLLLLVIALLMLLTWRAHVRNIDAWELLGGYLRPVRDFFAELREKFAKLWARRKAG